MNNKSINIKERINFFEKNGYCISENFLNSEECKELLRRMLINWNNGNQSYIHSSPFRIHCPIKDNLFTRSIIKRFIKENKLLLKNFFEDDIFWLCELSSICVFPNANRQVIHRDQSTHDKKLITCFINLFDVDENLGPLAVYEGGHKNINEKDMDLNNMDLNNMTKLLIKAGSCVIMDSRLPHAGYENTSKNSIRPVFYFSIGDPNLYGPVYSMTDDLKKKIKFNII